ncbi:MAG TPA: hypothetical protein VN372_07130 [Methanospirillum sp.]|nr:hypothetical protein [Methanospirillum sp.]
MQNISLEMFNLLPSRTAQCHPPGSPDFVSSSPVEVSRDRFVA